MGANDKLAATYNGPPETWEREMYNFGPGAAFDEKTGYRRTARRTVIPTERGTIELTRAEFDGLMKLAGYQKVNP